MHGDAHGMVRLVQPAGGQAVALGAEQQGNPPVGYWCAEWRGRGVRRQREQPAQEQAAL